MNTRMGTVNVRPVRLGYLIHRNDKEAFEQILTFSAEVWGGAHHPIIALDSPQLGDEALMWLRLYDPDVLVDLYGLEAETRERLGFERGLFPESGWLDDLESARRLAVPMSEVVEFAVMSGHQIPQEIYCSGPRPCGDSMIPMLLLGADPTSIPGTPRRMAVDALLPEDLAVPKFTRTFDRELWLSSARAWDLCKVFLNYRPAGPGANGARAFVVVTSNESVEDLALFWNLNILSSVNYRATRVWVFRDKDFEAGGAQLFADWLGREFAEPALSRGHGFELVMLSRSLAPRSLARLAESMGRMLNREGAEVLVTAAQGPDPDQLPGRFTEGIESRETVRTSPLTGVSSMATSAIREGKMRFAMGRKVVIEIDVEGSPVPKGHFSQSLLCADLPTRVAKGGLAFLIGPDDNVIDFKLPESTQLIQAALTDLGFDTRISDKGKYGLRLIDKLGGVEELPSLMDETLLNLLLTMSNEGPRPLAEIAKIVKLGSDELEPFVKNLILRGILRRGVMLTCHACGLRRWYPLFKINYDDHIHCDDCQIPIEAPVSFDFSFRVSGLFSVAVRQGTLTHLFTVFHEQRRLGYDTAFVPGLLVREMNREIDVVMIDRDGTMTIAECKYDGKGLRVADYDSTVAVAQNIGARVVIFSTLTDFSQAIYNRTEKEKRVRIRLLIRADLLNQQPSGESPSCR